LVRHGRENTMQGEHNAGRTQCRENTMQGEHEAGRTQIPVLPVKSK